MNVGNVLVTLGFVMIIIFGSLGFYTSLNAKTNNTDYLDLSGLENYDSYNDLYGDDYNTINNPDSTFQISDLGDLIFGSGYSMLKNVFGGGWLVLSTNILVTGLGFAPIDPVLIGLFVSIVCIIVLLIVVGAIMNRTLFGRDR